MLEAMTRQGSATAKGMAPSEMKEAPSSQAARPFSRSGSEKSRPRTALARAMPSGGVMPAAITAAMTSRLVALACSAAAGALVDVAARPAVAKV